MADTAPHIYGSDRLWHWLQEHKVSLAFTTYQTNNLFLAGTKSDGRLALNTRKFDKPMGLWAERDLLVMGTRHAIWLLENRLAEGESREGCDRLYVPAQSHTTGDLNVHELARDKNGQLLFINTDFSCLARLRPGYSFEPVWQPPFISQLRAEDRCHLNGLGMRDGEPTYATACAASDDPAGWRKQRTAGGIVMHIPSNELIATGLSMPHSPRWHQDKLWLLNSGAGELGFLDGERFVPVALLPGFARGLCFVGRYAVLGLSKLRASSFGGLPLEQRLAAQGASAQCGLLVIDTVTGAIVHALHIEGPIDELFDVVVLPDVTRPQALGFQDDSIERLISFPGSEGLITTKPTVRRPGLGRPAPMPGQARSPSAVKFQQVHHLNQQNLAQYDAMTYPSLQSRWKTEALRGELLGVSASIDGEMIGFAVAEEFEQEDASTACELLSLLVVPAFRHQGIATALLRHLQKLLSAPLPQPRFLPTTEQ